LKQRENEWKINKKENKKKLLEKIKKQKKLQKKNGLKLKEKDNSKEKNKNIKKTYWLRAEKYRNQDQFNLHKTNYQAQERMTIFPQLKVYRKIFMQVLQF